MLIRRFALKPSTLESVMNRWGPWLALTALILLTWGYAWALLYAPDDYQQGSMVRLLYLHVPTAWYAVSCYAAMAGFSGHYLIFKSPVSFYVAQSCGVVGITFTAACLVTGALWGKPMWGTYWVWDARLTSVLVMFFLYAGVLLAGQVFERLERSMKAASVLALIGVINLPLIKWSVDWFYTLHQPASIMKLDTPSIHSSMLQPLLICALGWGLYAAFLVLMLSVVKVRHAKYI